MELLGIVAKLGLSETAAHARSVAVGQAQLQQGLEAQIAHRVLETLGVAASQAHAIGAGHQAEVGTEGQAAVVHAARVADAEVGEVAAGFERIGIRPAEHQAAPASRDRSAAQGQATTALRQRQRADQHAAGGTQAAAQAGEAGRGEVVVPEQVGAQYAGTSEIGLLGFMTAFDAVQLQAGLPAWVGICVGPGRDSQKGGEGGKAQYCSAGEAVHDLLPGGVPNGSALILRSPCLAWNDELAANITQSRGPSADGRSGLSRASGRR
mmetsp:Transcript_53750/g.126708  ORF Transcript_53750/g.126708 Transcript_53750/m.126708 type:complete len:266 (+) Transcript_53750:1146-1943(+)